MDEYGNVVREPLDLVEARAVDALCRRYGCLPSAVLAEDVSMLWRLNLLALAEPEEVPGGQ